MANELEVIALHAQTGMVVDYVKTENANFAIKCAEEMVKRNPLNSIVIRRADSARIVSVTYEKVENGR
jgi:hypothetical protein